MSTAADLLGALRARGIALVAVGERLDASPASALTDEDCTAIRAHKPALLALLAAPTPPRAAPPQRANHDPWIDQATALLMTLFDRCATYGDVLPPDIDALGDALDAACERRDGMALEQAMGAFEAAVRAAAGHPPAHHATDDGSNAV